ncbi:MAG: hypothetical protein LQ346_003982 [Caloplaca aetnensis]|nr:MAG: hypothetical protein LQ346_003982 [Caloplaca aetnensis]
MLDLVDIKDMADRHALESAFDRMRGHFEDKETEANWAKRYTAIKTLNGITIGNSPYDFRDAYIAGIKSLVGGVIKAINSLRTTLSKAGCDLVEELAKVKLSGLDSTLEMIFPHLVKLCASTKKIAVSKAESAINTIIANVSYQPYLMRQISLACEDKNTQPRLAATQWLKTLVGRHRLNKAVFEKGEGLALFENCLKKGLADSNADVRKSMRAAYWAFIRLWPERSEAILSTLSEQHRKVLTTETADTASTLGPAKAPAVAAAKSIAPKAKPSIKDTIVAKRQAAQAEKVAEPIPAASNSNSARTLSSAPVRPSRTARKASAMPKPLSVDVSVASKPDPVSPTSLAKGIFDWVKGALSPKSEVPAEPLPRPCTPIEAGPAASNEASSPPTPPTVVKRSVKQSEVLRQGMDRPDDPMLSQEQEKPRKERKHRMTLDDMPMKSAWLPKPEVRALSRVDVKDMSPDERWTNVQRVHEGAVRRLKIGEDTGPLRKELRAHVRDLKNGCGIDTFHRIQVILSKNNAVLSEDTDLFNTLLFTIIEFMEQDRYHIYGAHPTGHDRNTQLLLVLRLLIEEYTALTSTYLPRILCALTAAGRNQHYSSHMQPCIKQTVQKIISQCWAEELPDCADALLDMMETKPRPQVHPQEEWLGLYALRLIVGKLSRLLPGEPEPSQQTRFTKLGALYCRSVYPEIRHQAIELLMWCRNFQQDDEKFWKSISTIGNDVSRLLTYYYEKMLAEARLVADRQLLEKDMNEDFRCY